MSPLRLLLVAACFLPAAALAAPLAEPDLDVGDEPGRVSTQETIIEDGPYARQMVFFRTTEAPGTVIIHTSERFLYIVQGNNRALRYGIGVGREGFTWAGSSEITAKREWPDWTPPPEMIARKPELPRHMPGGPDNPLGARAMYLGDTLYRIHGSNEPNTIGTAASSGCIRMTNDDVVDLYNRVKVGTKVVVLR